MAVSILRKKVHKSADVEIRSLTTTSSGRIRVAHDAERKCMQKLGTFVTRLIVRVMPKFSLHSFLEHVGTLDDVCFDKCADNNVLLFV